MWEAFKRATTRRPFPPARPYSPGGFRYDSLLLGAGGKAEEKGVRKASGGRAGGKESALSFTPHSGAGAPLKGRAPVEQGRPRPEPGGFAQRRGAAGGGGAAHVLPGGWWGGYDLGPGGVRPA